MNIFRTVELTGPLQVYFAPNRLNSRRMLAQGLVDRHGRRVLVHAAIRLGRKSPDDDQLSVIARASRRQ